MLSDEGAETELAMRVRKRDDGRPGTNVLPDTHSIRIQSRNADCHLAPDRNRALRVYPSE